METTSQLHPRAAEALESARTAVIVAYSALAEAALHQPGLSGSVSTLGVEADDLRKGITRLLSPPVEDDDDTEPTVGATIGADEQ